MALHRITIKKTKKYKKYEALNYWTQAKNFFIATETLDLLSKPLTLYYCFLNATKTLLTYKNVKFDTKHGVSGKRVNSNVNILNEMISTHP